MLGFRFARPVGAAADVKELEYIIALHQTSIETRTNATLSSQDVKSLLKSRYSLEISHTQAVEVVRSLGGGDSQQEGKKKAPASTSKGFAASIPDTKEASKVFDNMWKAVVAGIKFSFGNDRNDSGTNAEEDTPIQRSSEDTNGNVKTIKSTELSPNGSDGNTSCLPLGNMMRQLSSLHAANQRGTVDDQSLRILQETIANELSTKVLSSTSEDHRSLLISQEPTIDEVEELGLTTTATSRTNETTETNEMTTVFQSACFDSDDARDALDELEFGPPENIISHENEATNSQSEASSRREDSLEMKQEPNESTDNMTADMEPVPQFLDLVQVLSTVMIPTFARLADEAKNNEPPQRKDNASMPKLVARVIAYGRRKLEILDNDSSIYSGRQTLEIAKLALLKSISVKAPKVDESLVQFLLVAHGEIERASNVELVKEMVAAAQSASGCLDEEALGNAISSDLAECWDPRNEEVQSTFFYDVFGELAPSKNTCLSAVSDETNRSENDLVVNDVEFFKKSENQYKSPPPAHKEGVRHGFFSHGRNTEMGFHSTFSALDFVVDSQFSVAVTGFTWIFFILKCVNSQAFNVISSWTTNPSLVCSTYSQHYPLVSADHVIENQSFLNHSQPFSSLSCDKVEGF